MGVCYGSAALCLNGISLQSFHAERMKEGERERGEGRVTELPQPLSALSGL